MKKKNDFLSPAPGDYKWPRCAEADDFIERRIAEFLERHAFARTLAGRMMSDTSTRLSAWVDHITVLPRDVAALERLGFWLDKKARRPAGSTVYFHPFADLPKVIVNARARDLGCAVTTESISQFQLANGFAEPIEGAPFSTYRLMRVCDGAAELLIVERRGAQNFMPDPRKRADAYALALERWANRRRSFASDKDGMKQTLKLANEIVKALGTGPASHVFLEGERAYWQSRNRAGQLQKARQDQLGLGWANHDHHTFRSSRQHFPALMDIFLAFGFKKRERYYAGAQAGWGAQILEQPESGTVIFADVDLTPDEVLVDFTTEALPDLKKPGTIGLWCALHGESMLQAGMHHLEAKFDFDRMREDMKQRLVETMPPFSDFSFLRQAFTKGEMWMVPKERLDALRSSGKLSDEAYEQIVVKGAVGSHLENLQRTEGFKGFNQRGVSEIIAAVNPEKLALAKQQDKGAA